jgi:uncharacterized protein
MSAATLDDTLDFVSRIANETNQTKIQITFHGGEPLMAPPEYWRQALTGLRDRFGASAVEIALQSNLWRLDDELCGLFREYRVEIGTSLDGPEDITDAQRGPGYFARTMQGVRRAQAQGMTVGCIATFTPASLPRWREVFSFFLGERLGFSIHPAVPALENPDTTHALPPEHYGQLLVELLDCYVAHRRELAVSSLDQICKGLVDGEGKVCTFRDCLGMFLAIDPVGNIYPCQRFGGRPQWRLGTLAERPGLEQLFASPVARRFRQREQQIRAECGDCAHLDHCRGGCPYNTWSHEGANSHVRDPYCEAYRTVFDAIQQRLSAEMAAEGNLRAVAERPYDGTGHPLLRRGPLIELVREGPHPSHVARTAKRIVAAVELARGPDIPAVADRLVALGLCRSRQSAQASLENLRRQLHPERTPLNNLYIHVTFGCQLRCTHCYACATTVAEDASSPEAHEFEISSAALEKLVREAKDIGFRQVIVTGGEPLFHRQRDLLLQTLSVARQWACPMNLVLRTNFALPLDRDTLRRIAAAFDQVVVSVDGDEHSHDARRGPGSYAATIRNLDAYAAAINPQPSVNRNPAELSLACVMRTTDLQGKAGQTVNALARRLGVCRIRFRPLLPLGRAQGWDEPPTSEALGGHLDPMELIESGFHPVASCGLGQNLYVEPSGESFPCYAYHQPHAFLGNVVERGLPAVLESPAFRVLAQHTVDTNAGCRSCEYRYLCGGACRAWSGEAAQHDLDTAPIDCAGLKRRAVYLLNAASTFLELEF